MESSSNVPVLKKDEWDLFEDYISKILKIIILSSLQILVLFQKISFVKFAILNVKYTSKQKKLLKLKTYVGDAKDALKDLQFFQTPFSIE